MKNFICQTCGTQFGETAVPPFAFDRIYGGWWDRVVRGEAKTAVVHSATRYIAALSG